MKINVHTLKRIIREELFRGLPQFLFAEATRKYVDEIKKHLQSHIQQTYGQQKQLMMN